MPSSLILVGDQHKHQRELRRALRTGSALVLMASDAASKQKTATALDRDLAAMKVHLNGAACEAAYDEAADKIKAMTTRR